MCEDQDYINTLRCCCGPHNRPVMKFTIDTKGISAEEVERVVERLRESMNKKSLINPVTGEIDYKYIPGNITQDFFIPIDDDNKTKLVGNKGLFKKFLSKIFG